MTYPCPHCRAIASPETGCPNCGRGPDADAIEVINADAEIATLLPQLATAQAAVHDLQTRIGHAYARRNQAANRVRTSLRPDQPKSAPETSSRAIQTLLFLLGGLLLAVAAIVFTAVAWSQFGVGGRAAILASFTAVTLAIPPVALRRGLRSAAETVAAVGVLLLLLDGYAAWYVNLFGLAHTDPARYAGVVFGVTTALAAGYAYLTGLTGPRYAALLVAQPALPLLVAPADPGPAGWTLTFGILAALNAAIHRTRLAPIAYALGGLAVLAAITPALVAAARTLDTAGPLFHATWSAAVPSTGWRLPAALAVVTAALFATLPARGRPAVLLGGAAAIALALPSGLHLQWWTAPIADLVVVAAALVLATRHPRPAPLIATLVLGLHAIGAAFGRPGVAAAALTVVALLGLATTIRARHAALAGAGLLTALLAPPAIAWTATAALGLGGAGQLRTVAVVAAALAAARFLPPATRRPFALVAALTAAAPLPIWALVAGEPVVVYAVLALLLVACLRPGTLGRVPEIVALAAAGFVLVVALSAGPLPTRTATLAALGALLITAAVTGTAGRTTEIRGLGVAVAVVAGWGWVFAAPPGAVLESYSMVASGLALAAALLARRGPTPSWFCFGPALTTALAPSLVLILTDDGQHLRRLLLGVGALAILLVGARFRQLAPVLAGGGTLALVAMHELVMVWDLVPRWIPPAAGGLLLVLIATTLERRRRDLARFRRVLARMG
ncbi:hypothetical protein Adu01nite_45260 [Paractinoplanes durhamensis]|uniref:DUF2157 domain-containing protein n=1 Tax=Paractinoplanes durhamensis TaxID=113563 RepID=A0ABQ3Z019_9ACTN|nr:hypothetical protein [Actinoplanes durhamensis]GIE03176.1 hypothetical protein Adu01nite_45260 [Actinoplanes durhamensis]